MRIAIAALVIATLLAGCAKSSRSGPGRTANPSRPTAAIGPDLTAYVAIAGVT